MDRPNCRLESCNSLAGYKGKDKLGKRRYHPLCTTHHKKRYGQSWQQYQRKQKNFPNKKCVLCGWDKAYCDRHRIVFGCKGGKYIKGNVIVVCPNCHRLIHLGVG